MAMLSVIPFAQHSIAQTTCNFKQITDSTGGVTFEGEVAISGNGLFVAFQSNGDFTAMNADGGPEVFLYDEANGMMKQIVSSPAGTFSGHPSLDGSGEQLAFISNADLAPGNNSDGNVELFLYRVSSGAVEQLTDTVRDHSFYPAISDSGTQIALMSGADLAPGENIDGSFEFFVFDIATKMAAQITDGITSPGQSNQIGPMINSDGTKIVFASDRDEVPPNNADLNQEIYLFDAASKTLTQITDTIGGFPMFQNTYPSVGGSEAKITFSSDFDLTPGGNVDLSSELFLFDAAKATFTQLTDTSFSLTPAISADGYVVAGRINGSFGIVDLPTGVVTYWSGASNLFGTSISRFGRSVAFQSAGDLMGGGNVDGNAEIFLAQCVPFSAVFFDGFESGNTTAWTNRATAE